MVPNSCLLENLLFDSFSTEDILLDDNSDPDKQFYNDSGNFYDTPYSKPNEAKDFLKKTRTILFYTSP